MERTGATELKRTKKPAVSSPVRCRACLRGAAACLLAGTAVADGSSDIPELEFGSRAYRFPFTKAFLDPNSDDHRKLKRREDGSGRLPAEMGEPRLPGVAAGPDAPAPITGGPLTSASFRSRTKYGHAHILWDKSFAVIAGTLSPSQPRISPTGSFPDGSRHGSSYGLLRRGGGAGQLTQCEGAKYWPPGSLFCSKRTCASVYRVVERGGVFSLHLSGIWANACHVSDTTHTLPPPADRYERLRYQMHKSRFFQMSIRALTLIDLSSRDFQVNSFETSPDPAVTIDELANAAILGRIASMIFPNFTFDSSRNPAEIFGGIVKICERTTS